MTIRKMTVADAKAVGELSGQLGYPMPESLVLERIASVVDRDEHAAFVAVIDDGVVGWIHVYVSHIIESPNAYVEIGGLVVEEKFRGQGVGKALVSAGENWTLLSGFDDIRLRSASKRTEAHAFYEKLGYQMVKTQMRFTKKLAGEK